MKLEAAITGFARQQAADGRSGHTRAACARDLRTFCDWLGEKAFFLRSPPTIWLGS